MRRAILVCILMTGCQPSPEAKLHELELKLLELDIRVGDPIQKIYDQLGEPHAYDVELREHESDRPLATLALSATIETLRYGPHTTKPVDWQSGSRKHTLHQTLYLLTLTYHNGMLVEWSRTSSNTK